MYIISPKIQTLMMFSIQTLVHCLQTKAWWVGIDNAKNYQQFCIRQNNTYKTNKYYSF